MRGVESLIPPAVTSSPPTPIGGFARYWAIAEKSRTIRLPIHITEMLNKLKKGQRELSQELGRTPPLPSLLNSLSYRR